jgi:hypothetical protein
MVFHCAVVGRAKDSDDLVPFWVLELEGGAKIERRQEDLLARLEQAIGITALRPSPDVGESA